MNARGGGPYVSEVITYGHHTPEGVVDQLLIDDGVPGRGHRHSLLRPAHRYAGIACGRHPVHRTMCVPLMSQTRDGSPSPQPKWASTTAEREKRGLAAGERPLRLPNLRPAGPWYCPPRRYATPDVRPPPHTRTGGAASVSI